MIGIIGFRTKSLIFWEEKFRKYCDELMLCTDDGSAGVKGYVTSTLKRALEQHPDVDEVVAVGPPVMMKACAESHSPAQGEDHGESQSHHGGRHGNVRRVQGLSGRQAEVCLCGRTGFRRARSGLR